MFIVLVYLILYFEFYRVEINMFLSLTSFFKHRAVMMNKRIESVEKLENINSKTNKTAG